MTQIDFAFFRDGPGGQICRSLGLDISDCQSWGELEDFAKEDRDDLEKRARDFDGVASSGEGALLLAVLYAVDFKHLADELADGRAFRTLQKAGGDFQLAVAACFARIDQARR